MIVGLPGTTLAHGRVNSIDTAGNRPYAPREQQWIEGDMAYEVCVFGSFTIQTLEHSDLTPRSRKAAALLSFCILATPKPVRRERLAELLWGDRGEEQARASLRQALYELRALAGRDHALLIIDRNSVQAERSVFHTDLYRLQNAADQYDAERTLAALNETSEILLADLSGVSAEFDEWLLSERIRHHNERRRLALEVAAHSFKNGSVAVAGRIAELLVASDPLDEAAARLAIEASAELGEIDHGRRIFARLEASLSKDLAVVPSPETVAASKRLERGTAEPQSKLLAERFIAATAPPIAKALMGPASRFPRWILVSASLMVLALCLWAWLGLRPSSTSGKHVLVEQFHVEPGDSPAQVLRQSLATDLTRMVVGSDAMLDFADLSDGASSNEAVEYLVSGDARTNEGSLHAAVRLVSSADHSILWSRDFSGPAGDVDGLRQQMASKIADVLICALGSRSKRPADIDVPTLRLFLAGCENWHTDWPMAQKYFGQVVQRRADFAQARAMLAASLYLSTGTFSSLEPKDWDALRRSAITQAQHALAQDPHFGAAYFAIAGSLKGEDRDLERLRILEKGNLADPTDGLVQTSLAVIFDSLGLTKASLFHTERAVALDPFAPIYASNLAETYAYTGRNADASTVLEQASRYWPGEFYTGWTRFEIAARVGNAADAIAMLNDPTRNPGYHPKHPQLWRIFIKARERPTAVSVNAAQHALLSAEPKSDDQGRAEIVQDLAQLGRIDQAYSVALRSPPISGTWNFIWFRNFMSPFREDRRFLAVLDKQGITPMWRRMGKQGDFCTDPKLNYRCPL